MYIDSHAHYYDEAFASDADEAIARALSAGVEKIVQADVDRSERQLMFQVGERHKGVLFQMVGLYPGSVGNDWQEELYDVEAHLGKDIVAIGEIGLDYHEGDGFRQLQKEVFRIQLELAAKRDLPVNIHLRDAWEDLFEILAEKSSLGLRGCLHCFGGSYESYCRARKYGDFSVGIGGVVTFKNSHLAETVKRIPMEHILLETDCPYLAPVPHRGRRNESSLLPLIAAKVAEAKGVSLEEVAHATKTNAEKLYRI